MNMRAVQASGWLLFWLTFAVVWAAQPVKAQRTATIATCGTLTQATPALGSAGIIGLDQNGNVCVSASVTASVTGFAPAGTFATLTATGSSASVALPAGAVVVFSNTGTTAVSCTLGIGSATAVASNNVIQSGSWMALTVGSNTFGACIDQAGSASNVVVLSGGSGLPTGAGGGGSGGGGGAVTIADAADVTQGGVADAACATDNGSCTVTALIKRENQRLTTLITNLGTSNANGPTTEALSSPVTLATNQRANALWGHGATGAAPPANITYAGVLASGATGGLTRGLISCDNHVFKHITSATDTLAVQGVASQTIYICGWKSRAAGVATWYWENTNDANANCNGSLTQIGGVSTEAANTGEVVMSPFWNGFKNTAGNGLCIKSTGTGGVDIDLWYTQF